MNKHVESFLAKARNFSRDLPNRTYRQNRKSKQLYNKIKYMDFDPKEIDERAFIEVNKKLGDRLVPFDQKYELIDQIIRSVDDKGTDLLFQDAYLNTKLFLSPILSKRRQRSSVYEETIYEACSIGGWPDYDFMSPRVRRLRSETDKLDALGLLATNDLSLLRKDVGSVLSLPPDYNGKFRSLMQSSPYEYDASTALTWWTRYVSETDVKDIDIVDFVDEWLRRNVKTDGSALLKREKKEKQKIQQDDPALRRFVREFAVMYAEVYSTDPKDSGRLHDFCRRNEIEADWYVGAVFEVVMNENVGKYARIRSLQQVLTADWLEKSKEYS